MKTTSKLLLLMLVLGTAAMLSATTITVGNHDSGNCYPFMCNDSGSNVGQSIDYQEVYKSTAFSGPLTVNEISYPLDTAPDYVLGGYYQLYWGYSAVGMNLSTNFASNYVSAPAYLGYFNGGFSFGSALVLYPNFTYDPSQGDLILEWIVTNQENIPNYTTNGYNAADYAGLNVIRAWCVTNVNCAADNTGALQTVFYGTGTTPEPGTLIMLGSGIIGLAGVLRRKINL